MKRPSPDPHPERAPGPPDPGPRQAPSPPARMSALSIPARTVPRMSPRPTALPTPRAGVRGMLRTQAWALLPLGLALLAGSARAQGSDQVWFADRDGAIRQVTGTITENSLSSVKVVRSGNRENSYDSDRVRRVEWGQVSNDYREARDARSRGDHLNAARRFRDAANGDDRPVVKASARLGAAQALVQLGSKEPERLAEAMSEVGRFLSDFPTNREVPRARFLQAQVHWLEGRAAEAADGFRRLFEDGAGPSPTKGYDRQISLEAGLAAGRAFLDVGDHLRARELFGALESAANTFSAEFAEGSPERAAAERIAVEARLGEGFALLVAGQPNQAVPFFEARRGQGGSAARHGCDLGLGEAFLAQGKLREAQVKFASVAALDYSDRWRAARARLRLAETSQRLGDSSGAALARKLLTEIVERFGDTPAVRQARTLLAG